MNNFKTRVRYFENVPFDISYQHTRYFANKKEQEDYFNYLKPKTAFGSNELKWVRIDLGEILLHGNFEDFNSVNYIEIINDGKTYYAFVTEIEYTNNSSALIKFEIDVMQTYMFDITFHKSFIEREHCNRWNKDGTPIINTVPENLDLGSEYVTIVEKNASQDISTFFNIKILLITTTEKLSGDSTKDNYNYMSGAPNSLYYYMAIYTYRNDSITPSRTIINNNDSMDNNFENLMSELMKEENTNKVVSFNFLPFIPFRHTINYNPSSFTTTIESDFLLATSIYYSRVLSNNITPKKIYEDVNIFKGYLDTDKTKESKLLFYPYSYLALSDSSGSYQVIKPEYMKNGNLIVYGKSIIDSKFKAIYYVENYKGNKKALDDSLISNLAPDIAVINEYTATYLQGNKHSMMMSTGLGVVGGIGAMGVGLATANPFLSIGGATSIVGSLGGLMGKSLDINNIPNSLSKQNGNSTYNIGDDLFIPLLQYKQISYERFKMIEDYFKTYGYATNRVKYPNLNTRKHFNFVKTVGCNITGKMPNDSIRKIKQIFDSGITLWHVNDVQNYNLTNEER